MVTGADALFERWPGAALLIDSNGRLLRCTPSAVHLLERTGCVERSPAGDLAFADAATRQALTTAVQRCLDSGRPTPCPALPRGRALRHTVVLHLHALGGRAPAPPPFDAATSGGAVLALLTALQPERDALAEEAIVRSALGLTHGEARVALALHEHADVSLAAQALCSAPGTARSHLKRIYQKLHVSRQGELILLVERCLAAHFASRNELARR